MVVVVVEMKEEMEENEGVVLVVEKVEVVGGEVAGQGKPMAAIFVACHLLEMVKERNVKEREKNVKRGVYI